MEWLHGMGKILLGQGRRGRCGRENTFWAYWETGSHFMGRMAPFFGSQMLSQASGRPTWYDSATESKVCLRLTSEVKSGSFSSVTHFRGRGCARRVGEAELRCNASGLRAETRGEGAASTPVLVRSALQAQTRLPPISNMLLCESRSLFT